MHIAKHSLVSALAACALLLFPATSIGESVLVGSGSASAGQEFRIVIPSVLRVLENRYPVSLVAESTGNWSAQQRLVVASNMKRGFCVTLRVSVPEVQAWRLRTPQVRDITQEAVRDGYRLCASGPGRYALVLNHEFDAATQRSAFGALLWPVQTDITAL
ncbi:hypothetical protein [Hydrogenophaga sp.]|uniref:hypothetical protein n=1 Tax=Hydrogenophaga sp. TaxID=1904254 RepID=UPI003AF91719